MGIDAEMYFGVVQALTEREREDLGFRLASAFDGVDRRQQYNTHGVAELRWSVTLEDAGDRHIYEIELVGRYYGPGYERGDFVTYKAIAEWLEVAIPGCMVWYGGDSCGAEPFGPERRAALWRHFVTHDRRPYRQGFFARDPRVICPYCQQPCTVYGCFGATTSQTCDGCGAGYMYSPKDGVTTKAGEPVQAELLAWVTR